MNKFKKLGFIKYEDGLQINSSLLSVVLTNKSCSSVALRNTERRAVAFARLTAYASTIAPVKIRNPPGPVKKHVIRSWRKIAANTIAITTLSLSTGATCEASPSCKARK